MPPADSGSAHALHTPASQRLTAMVATPRQQRHEVVPGRRWAVKLSRPGSVIVLDNVIRDGRVTDASSEDRNVRGSRAAFDFFHDHLRLDSTALQTVGLKGYDGFAIALVKAP